MQFAEFATVLRRDTNSQLEPLQNQLADVEAAIAEQKRCAAPLLRVISELALFAQRRKTHQAKAQILRNDATIKQLLESRSQMD